MARKRAAKKPAAKKASILPKRIADHLSQDSGDVCDTGVIVLHKFLTEHTAEEVVKALLGAVKPRLAKAKKNMEQEAAHYLSYIKNYASEYSESTGDSVEVTVAGKSVVSVK